MQIRIEKQSLDGGHTDQRCHLMFYDGFYAGFRVGVSQEWTVKNREYFKFEIEG